MSEPADWEMLSAAYPTLLKSGIDVRILALFTENAKVYPSTNKKVISIQWDDQLIEENSFFIQLENFHLSLGYTPFMIVLVFAQMKKGIAEQCSSFDCLCQTRFNWKQ